MSEKARSRAINSTDAGSNPPLHPDISQRLELPLSTPRKRIKSGIESHIFRKEISTPVKAKIQGVIEFNKAKKLPVSKEEVFRFYGVSHASGHRILAEDSARKLDSKKLNARHAPRSISAEKVWEMEKVIEREGWDGHAFTWEQLGQEVGLDSSGQTIRRTMGSMDYYCCIACKKGWCNPKLAERRLEFARTMLEKYPHWHDWKHVRFSDEVHFGFGPEGKVHIIRKAGTRYCSDCIQKVQREPEVEEKNQKRFHCWSAIGWNFKAPMVFYDVPGNSNGKITHRVYIDSILEPVVKPWLEHGPHFVLEEDGDSGHGTSAKNIVRTWKEQHQLESYFNCASSPDLSIIENGWQVPKQYVRKYPHWTDEATKELILEG